MPVVNSTLQPPGPDPIPPSPVSPFAAKIWLAPLTIGGNLPFRRLCVELGAEVTVGEMAVVRRLLEGKRGEFALLRSHSDEPWFGVQLADKKPETLAEGARLAEARGARFVDLNCGCPINEITGRGLGASLLKKPGRIARLVAAMCAAVQIPVTVKLRAGWSEGKENVGEVARACEEAGAAAITVHGRTRDQRYSRAADWDLVGKVASERKVPVVGNGDILTHYEAEERQRRSGAASLMVGRGALIKPWVFREIRERREWLPSASERLAIIWRYVELLRDHFGEGEENRRRSHRFLSWHLDFLCRYRPLPESQFLESSLKHPLLQSRFADDLGVTGLEALLRDPRPEVHQSFASEMLEAASCEEAEERARRLWTALPPLEETATAAPADRQVQG
jgi:tRNA-dihydrouridine synthase 3